MNTIISLIQDPASFIALFTVVSIVLNAVAQVLQELGKQAPPWLSDVLGFVGKALHFLNGNFTGVTAITKTQATSAVVTGAVAGVTAAASGSSIEQAAVTAAESAAKAL